MTKPIQCIVGLGNPGPEYENTRHNAGAWLLDQLCRDWGVTLKADKKFKGDVAISPAEYPRDYPLYCLHPTTFMNNSGQAVRALMHFYKLQPEQILVLHDELDLPPGTVRLKQGGGHAGHNGLRDIISQIHSPDFYRLRVGIGHPGESRLVHDYVLKKPSKSDYDAIMTSITQTLYVLPDILQGKLEQAMTQLHTAK